MAQGPASGDLIETDALVIGAGPIGLFQVFQLGLLDIRAQVVDALPAPGGQPLELYPDKPIYDLPAIPVCTGRELAQALLRQIRPFGAGMHLGQTVTALETAPDGRFQLATHTGTRFLTRTVFIAAGVGAFEPRRLKVEGLARHEGRQLHYRVDDPDTLAASDLVIVGGDESALHWAAHFAADGPQRARSVTLVHRRDVFDAPPDLQSRVQALREQGAIRFVPGQVGACEADGDGPLAAVQVNLNDGGSLRLPLDHLLVFQGLSPKLGPVAEWGLAMERKQLVVDTEKFATSVPGIFAVGDINTYPGKRKLLVSGFHECTLAAYAAAPIVYPDRPVLLQYTTTSPKLQQRLGVLPPAP